MESRALAVVVMAVLAAACATGGSDRTRRGAPRDAGEGGDAPITLVDGGEGEGEGEVDGGPGVDAFVPPVDGGPACARVTCDPHATCMEVGGVGMCSCNAGYTGDGATCTDIDECAMGTAGCDPRADCMNTDGSSVCTCRGGFMGDGRSCTDVDECVMGTAGCSPMASCFNTDGSAMCTCIAGYTGDGRSCTDIDECVMGTDTCHANATCINGGGSYSCMCNPGFTGDGFSCTPIGPTCTPVETFERGWPFGDVSWAAGPGSLTPGTRGAAAAHDGSFGVTDPDWYYETAMLAGGAGTRVRAWVRLRGSGRIYLGFDASAGGTKSFVLAPNTGDIRFQDNAGWGYGELTTAGVGIAVGMWYRMELEFVSGGTMTGRLFGSDGTTLIASVTHTYPSVGTGGIALRAFGTYDIDTIEICR